MNNFNEQGVRGALRNPSARRSIHNHWGCPFATVNMNQRGDKRYQENVVFKNNESVDEIDNALSKFAHPITPPSNQRKYIRSNSLEIKNKLNRVSDDDSDVLSKSLPTTLPSKLHCNCSDESDSEEESRHRHNSANISVHTFETSEGSNMNRSFSRYATPQPIDSPEVSYKKIEKSNQLSYVSKVTVIFVIILSIVSVSFFNANMSNTYDKLKFYTDVSVLGERYNIDANSILQVQSGVSTIFDKSDTGSFIFVYNSNADNFNHSEFNKFINGVSSFTAKYLRNESASQSYITVDGSELNMEKHSELIARYRNELNRVGLMLVRHLEDIPSYLAMAFHFYCDEYNPLVKKSAIFFTLNVAKCPQVSENKSSHVAIEKCLAKKWSSVPLDSISPLLTRVVNVVIDVTSAF